MSGWLETYRGSVFAWEVDTVGHFTVACYFERLGDATLVLLEALGLGPGYMRREGRACLTADCYVRYREELRAGDVLHVESGVIDVDAAGLLLGHKIVKSDTKALCTTIEQRAVHVALDGSAPVALGPAPRAAAAARRVPWDGPPRERRPQPRGTDGFLTATRGVVQPWEIDLSGRCALQHYVHRFSAAGIQTFATFGMTPAYQRSERRGMSTFEFQLQLPGALYAGDVVTVKTGLLHLGNSSIRVYHQLFKEGTDEPVATLDQFGVHLDTEARRPAPIPEALRQRAKAMLAPVV
jgi:acyl-CoA thioester hydrolase